MVKILILVLSIGLAALTGYLMHLSGAPLVAAIVGLTFAYIVGFIILFFLFAIIFSLPISKKSPKVKYSKFYRGLYTASVWFALSLFGVHTNVVGSEKIPQGTTFLLVQNHLSNTDPLITNGVFKKYPMIFVAKESLFKIPFFGKYIHKVGFVKLKRERIVYCCGCCREYSSNKFYEIPTEHNHGFMDYCSECTEEILNSVISPFNSHLS